MVSELNLKHSALNTYHNNTSLLFQFILFEFLLAFRQMKIINQQVSPLHQENLFSSNSIALMEAMRALAGSSQEYMRLFNWNITEGSMAKLKNYCALLSEKDEREDHRLTAMHRCSNRAWLLCLHGMDLLRPLFQREAHHHFNSDVDTSKNQSVQQALYQTVEKISHHMRRIARLIAEVSFDYRQDENVLFFFLRYRQEFDSLFGSLFVSKLFLKMSPEGHQTLAAFIKERYRSRGFFELLPVIDQYFQDLEVKWN